MRSPARPQEFERLLSTLKKIMKAQRVTYATLAGRIGLSEPSIKRIFTSSDASFARIIDICSALGIAFADLVQQSAEPKESVFTLTHEQEAFFAAQPAYYAFLRGLLETSSDPAMLRKRYKLSDSSLRKYLKKLEQLRLLERLPKDQIRLNVQGTHNWLEGGPFQKKFLKTDSREFVEYLTGTFHLPRHFMSTSDRRIHPDTFASMISDLKGLASTYRKRAYRDELYYPANELTQVKWLLGASPYQRKWDDLIEDL